ncbi:MAG: hypothetical protein FJ279_20440 [Planctomycetes bacterium]|nr:hypothetical protein [Planctomycetota bacterium]
MRRSFKRSMPLSASAIAACCLSTAAAAESYTMMPPYPTDPLDYVNKWDPFVLRLAPGAREPLIVAPTSAKV